MFINTLKRFESISLLKNLEAIAWYVNELKNKELWDEIHSLKGGAGYCSAGMIYDTCNKMQIDHDNGLYREMY